MALMGCTPKAGRDYLQNLGKRLFDREGNERKMAADAFYAIECIEFAWQGAAPGFLR
jgi:hypothetical protein